MSSTRNSHHHQEHPSTEQLILLGDFNARVGADCDSWPSRLGPFEVGKMNESGQRKLKSSVPSIICASPTPFSRPSLNTGSLGDTRAQSIGTNLI